MAPDNTLRSYEVNIFHIFLSVQERVDKLNIIYSIITGNPDPQATWKSNCFRQLFSMNLFNSLVHSITQ